MEMAIIGSDDFVTGFQLAGLKHSFVVTDKEIDEKVNRLIGNQDFGVLVMEEKDFQALSFNTKKRLEKAVTPVIVTLSETGQEVSLREMIKQNVGVDLWK